MPSSVGAMRRRAGAFALAVGASEEMTHAVELAVSETVRNAVIHAYVGRESGRVSVRCLGDRERLIVEGVDEGVGVAARDDSPESAPAWRSSARWRRRSRSRPGPAARARS